MQKKKQFPESVYIFVPLCIIAVLGLLFIKDNMSIKILGDEFGYWMASSWMLGKDWSDIASINSYYGYGYGVLLSLIMMLPINSVLKYQLALVLNVIMLMGVYLIIYYLLNKVCTLDKKITALIALCATVYTGNLYHSQFTMIETLFLLGFWLFILLLQSIYNNYKLYKVLLGIVLLAYLYSSHNRALSMVFAGLLCMSFIQLNEKRYRDFIILLVVSVTLFACSEWIKAIYQDTYLTNDYLSNLHYNDYSGQVSKVTSLKSSNGFFALVCGIIGKFFYLLSSTYLLGGVALYQIVKHLLSCLKEKTFHTPALVEAFVFLSALASIGITSIYFIDFDWRFDLLIYGRYHEFFVSALIVIGLITLLTTEKTDIKQMVVIFITYIISTIITHIMIPYDTTIDFTYLFSTGICDSLDSWNRNIIAVGFKTIAIFALILLISYWLKKQRQNVRPYCICAFLSVLWISTYIYTYDGRILSWSPLCDQSEIALADRIKMLGCEDDLYFYANEGHQVDHLQFLLEDANIKCVFSAEQIESLSPDACLLLQTNSAILDTELLKDYKLTAQSTRIQLWMPKESF